ncbi:hypothetical protein [Pantoea sp. 18069]|uniref:hypothetical protein n=1 Tax=Pantoea sp. 18069 TaxID=2681415 RepID=UPI00135809FE|nr:hypothetical protein [Pantoea sp. 18069]
MSSSLPPTHDLAAHTFGRHQFSPPPLPESLERASTVGALAGGQDQSCAPVPDLDQRIRDVGEW